MAAELFVSDRLEHNLYSRFFNVLFFAERRRERETARGIHCRRGKRCFEYFVVSCFLYVASAVFGVGSPDCKSRSGNILCFGNFKKEQVMVLYNADLSGMVGNRDGIKPGGMDFKLRKRRAERIVFPSFLNA